MSSIEKVKQRLMKYAGSFGGAPNRVFTLRDFNTQVMMHSFSPEERVLDEALAELVASGAFVRQSPTEYVLTADGYRLYQSQSQESATADRNDRAR